MVDTHIPKWFWNQLAGASPFESFQSIILISLFTVVGSQLVGNVAIIIMAEEEVSDLDDNTQRLGWLLLSWVSTVAGNFTLAGSAANIIVAEKAKSHPKNSISLTTNVHFKYNGFLAIFCIVLGAVIIYLEAMMMGYT